MYVRYVKLPVAVLGTAGSGAENICGAYVWKFLLNKLFFKLSSVKILKLCFVVNDESFVTFFIWMRCTGKRHILLQTGRSISFLQICAWNVLGSKENQVTIKNTGCFLVISLKFLIANWNALILFLLVAFFCLNSKNIFFLIFSLTCGAPSGYKSAWPEAVDPLAPP